MHVYHGWLTPIAFALAACAVWSQTVERCVRTLEHHRFDSAPFARLAGLSKNVCIDRCLHKGLSECRAVVYYNSTRPARRACELFKRSTGTTRKLRAVRVTSDTASQSTTIYEMAANCRLSERSGPAPTAVVGTGSTGGRNAYKETASAGSGTSSGSWQQWGSWAGCDTGNNYGSGGGGGGSSQTQYATRTRECNSYGGCGGGSTNEQKPCQQPAQWSQWSQWAGCSATCGEGGTRTRQRQCTPAGGNCAGQSRDTAPCPPLAPCEQCQWSQWAQWGYCSATCGQGQKTRDRQQLNKGNGNAYGGDQPCPGDSTDSSTCDMGSCASWSEWTPWSSCSEQCGPGEQIRTRECSPQGGNCVGDSLQSQPCDAGECCQWGQWSQWSQCSATCGYGQKARQRNPLGSESQNPYSGASPCPGDSSERTDCDGGPCAEWGPWQAWSSCSASCGSGGTKSRNRQCNPPGANCVGQGSQSQSCSNGQECCSWGQWTAWSACSATCGDGSQTRNRQCSCGSSSGSGYGSGGGGSSGGSGGGGCGGGAGAGTESTACTIGPCSGYANTQQFNQFYQNRQKTGRRRISA